MEEGKEEFKEVLGLLMDEGEVGRIWEEVRDQVNNILKRGSNVCERGGDKKRLVE